MAHFKYGLTELAHLRQHDEKLGQIIDRVGMLQAALMPDLFEALVNCIVGQQISSKAAVTVWNRMLDRFGAITPAALADLSAGEIQRCGMSMRKAGYIKNAAEAVRLGTFDLDELPGLSDAEVVQRLSALPGIGVWTAEMLLIFSMQRPDVVSWGDLGIRRGMMSVYGLEGLTRSQFNQYRQQYSPYGSVASLYLWKIAENPDLLFSGNRPVQVSQQSR